jgi:hypothetical protein
MANRIALVALMTLLAVPVGAQMPRPKLFVDGADGFEVYISAALAKKDVGVDVVTDSKKADYVMKATAIEVQKVGTGSKVVNCLFMSCAGNSDKGNTSVQVIDKEGVVKWSYAVNKGRGEKNKQAMAEAIAKHFKSEFLRQK